MHPTFVEMTRSFCFHPYFLIACPRTISALPPEYTSAVSKKLIPASYAAFMHSKAVSACNEIRITALEGETSSNP